MLEMSTIDLLNTDDEDDIWDYRSQSRLSKRSAEVEQTRLCSTQIKKEPSERIKTERSEFKSKKHRTSATRQKDSKQKVKEKTPHRIKCEQKEGRCPLCQMPFSLLSNIESTKWHIDTCIAETPTNTTQECPKGELCDSVVASHYKKFRHTQLAQSESKQHQEAASKKFGNVEGARSKLNFEAESSSNFVQLAIPSTFTDCIIDLVSSSDVPSGSQRSGDNLLSAAVIDNVHTFDKNMASDFDENLADEVDCDFKESEDVSFGHSQQGVKMVGSGLVTGGSLSKGKLASTSVEALSKGSDKKPSESVSSSGSSMSEIDEADYEEITVDSDHEVNGEDIADTNKTESVMAAADIEHIENGKKDKDRSALQGSTGESSRWANRFKHTKNFFHSDDEDSVMNDKRDKPSETLQTSTHTNMATESTVDVDNTGNLFSAIDSHTNKAKKKVKGGKKNPKFELKKKGSMLFTFKRISNKQKSTTREHESMKMVTKRKKSTDARASNRVPVVKGNISKEDSCGLEKIEVSDLSSEKNSTESITISQMLGSPGEDVRNSDNEEKESGVGRKMDIGGLENLLEEGIKGRMDCTGDNNTKGAYNKPFDEKIGTFDSHHDNDGGSEDSSEDGVDSSDLEIIGTTITQPSFSQYFKKVKSEQNDIKNEIANATLQDNTKIESIHSKFGEDKNETHKMERSSREQTQNVDKDVPGNDEHTSHCDETVSSKNIQKSMAIKQPETDPENSNSSTGFFARKMARLYKQIQSDLGNKWVNTSTSRGSSSSGKNWDMYSSVKKKVRKIRVTQSEANPENGDYVCTAKTDLSAAADRNSKDHCDTEGRKQSDNSNSGTGCSFKGSIAEVGEDSRSSFQSEPGSNIRNEKESVGKGKSLLGKRAKLSSKGTQRSQSIKRKKEPNDQSYNIPKKNDIVIIIETDNESTNDATDYGHKRCCCLNCSNYNVECAKKATYKSVKFELRDEDKSDAENIQEAVDVPGVEIEIDAENVDNKAVEINVNNTSNNGENQGGDRCQAGPSTFSHKASFTVAEPIFQRNTSNTCSSSYMNAEHDDEDITAGNGQDKTESRNTNNSSERQTVNNSVGSQNLNNSEKFGSIPSTPRFEIDNICTLSQNTYAQLGGGFIPEGEEDSDKDTSNLQQPQRSNLPDQEQQNSEVSATDVIEFVTEKVTQIQKNAVEILMASSKFLYGNLKGKGKKPAKIGASGSQQSIWNFLMGSSFGSQNRNPGAIPGPSQGSQGMEGRGQGNWLADRGQSPRVEAPTKKTGFGSSKQVQNSQQTKQCPFYKKIPDTGFTVDAFRYGLVPGCKAYFLTHFHGDHYAGLNKQFTGPIYCTKITGNLVRRKIGVNSQYIHTIPLDTETEVEGVRVTFIEANHCPGAVLILFKLTSGKTYLHTGDFRACPAMEIHPALQNVNIQDLYLDTTYCDPQYDFPSQEDVIALSVQLVIDRLATYPDTLIVCGSYTIGKERIFTAIAETLDCKICVTQEKKTVLDCLEAEWVQQRVRVGWQHSRLHVLTMNKLNMKGLEEHLERNGGGVYTHVMAIEPTGWSHSRQRAVPADTRPKVDRNNITIYALPYSEHSSFLELKRFIQFTKPHKILPTVNNGNVHSRKKMEVIFQTWQAENRSTR